MKKDDLLKAAIKAKADINDEINAFIEKLDKNTDDPDSFITMDELESEWKKLNLSTNKTYSNMMGEALSAIDTKELVNSKKGSSSRKE